MNLRQNERIIGQDFIIVYEEHDLWFYCEIAKHTTTFPDNASFYLNIKDLPKNVWKVLIEINILCDENGYELSQRLWLQQGRLYRGWKIFNSKKFQTNMDSLTLNIGIKILRLQIQNELNYFDPYHK